jgi:DNA-binding transcriptional regulator YiaG
MARPRREDDDMRSAKAPKSELRGLRAQLRLSQAAFATVLGVSLRRTGRGIQAGGRFLKSGWRGSDCAASRDRDRLLSLQELARELGVHVRTLRDAARSGRLVVTYGNRVVFRNPVPKATLAAGQAFISDCFRCSYVS